MTEPEGESVRPAPTLHLLGNAYDFLNESLRNATRAETDETQWKFAIINVAQAIELFLKARLAGEHPQFIYTNIDKPRHTVSTDVALDRLVSIAKVDLDRESVERIVAAKEIRNDIVHFAINLSLEQLRAAYLDMFEFAHLFHAEHLGGELHDHVLEELWPVEASLFESFRAEIVVYQGAQVHHTWVRVIVESQFVTALVDPVGRSFPRIPYGAPNDDVHPDPEQQCPNCGVRLLQYHGWGCEMEKCPACDSQLLSCGCELDAPSDVGAPDELDLN